MAKEIHLRFSLSKQATKQQVKDGASKVSNQSNHICDEREAEHSSKVNSGFILSSS